MLVIITGAAVASLAAWAPANGSNGTAANPMERSRRCTLAPGGVRALLTVERDTTLPFALSEERVLSSSMPARALADPSVATAGTPMPAARVRLLRVDSATRAMLHAAGVTDEQPHAYIRAAPYGADCRTVRWTDSLPWTQAGDTGYVVATLASRDQWIQGTPVLVIPDVWNYPYPRQTGLTAYPPSRPPFASADAMFSFEEWMHRGRGQGPGASLPEDSVSARAVTWASRNIGQREREPLRSRIRESILSPDFRRASSMPSRFRGTWRVEVQSGDQTASWQFRTVDRPAYRWVDVDSSRTVGDLIALPHVAGHRLVGYAADSAGALPLSAPRGMAIRQSGLVWLAVADRPTVPGSDTVTVVTAMLEFQRKGVPRNVWRALDAYIPPLRAADSVMMASMRIVRTAGDDQPRLPLTLRVARNGDVVGDTTFERAGRRLRVRLTRVDTLAVQRPF